MGDPREPGAVRDVARGAKRDAAFALDVGHRTLVRMTILFLVLSLWAPLAGVIAHPDSRSSSRLVVRDARATLELTAQVRTVIEALPLDTDGDAALSAAELAAAREAYGAYVLGRYRLFADLAPGDERELLRAEPLPGRIVDLALLPAEESSQGEPRVLARFEFQAASRIDSLVLSVSLFREQNPFHRDEARLEFQGDEPTRHLFAGVEGTVWRYVTERERRPGVFVDYWKEGVHHIAGGYDHLAFLAALLFAARRVRSVVAVISAFTLAHTLTLALATFDLVEVRSDLVEMAIALSISYVGALNLMTKVSASRWIEAFLFGLVHGLGFAGAIRDALSFETLRFTALLGFNLGVESGQLAIVIPFAIVMGLFGRIVRRPAGPTAEEERLAPRWLARWGSAVVTVLGLYWFAERAGFLW